ncbi:MAG TPA: M23 family metallopeptidase, partial [Firmicutes bacterium]|nr:M23 family metallopeptidase [Bacillota bacterium]
MSRKGMEALFLKSLMFIKETAKSGSKRIFLPVRNLGKKIGKIWQETKAALNVCINRMKQGLKWTFSRVFAVKNLIVIIIAFSMVAMSVTAVQGYFDGFGYVVKINGKEVAFIYEDDKGVVEDYITSLAASAEAYYDRQVQLNEEVEFLHERRPGKHIEVDSVIDDLQSLLSFSVLACAVLVDGKETVVVSCTEDFNRLVEILSNAYVHTKNNVVVKDVDFREEIVPEIKAVAPENIIELKDAANILLTGTPRRETYLVSRGDSLWSISRSNDMTVEELKEANPQIKGDLIRPGDELSLVVSEPIVNISIIEEITVKEKIPFDTQYETDSDMWRYQTKVIREGSHGEKEATYLVTLENGAEVSRELISEKVTKEPVTRVIARGTADIPSLGSGRFGWPLSSGAGTITSPFGWRWGTMHKGVDIAATRGTAIKAADSGVVSYSAYRSSYGNLVIISHGNGYETYYAHNSLNLVSPGEKVEKGQTIALMG